jgi:hypothetical protein
MPQVLEDFYDLYIDQIWNFKHIDFLGSDVSRGKLFMFIYNFNVSRDEDKDHSTKNAYIQLLGIYRDDILDEHLHFLELLEFYRVCDLELNFVVRVPSDSLLFNFTYSYYQ